MFKLLNPSPLSSDWTPSGDPQLMLFHKQTRDIIINIISFSFPPCGTVGLAVAGDRNGGVIPEMRRNQIM